MEFKGKATSQSFLAAFEAFTAKTDNYRKADEEAEKEHEAVFGCRKYSDYQSFKVQKCRQQKLPKITTN